MNMKTVLYTAGVVLATLAIVNRVGPLKAIVNP